MECHGAFLALILFGFIRKPELIEGDLSTAYYNKYLFRNYLLCFINYRVIIVCQIILSKRQYQV
jgi:hypothetical protein